MAMGDQDPIGQVGEWSLIQALFSRGCPIDTLRVGIGDDAAILAGEGDKDWAATVDTLTEGIHALPGCDPEAFAWKSVAVNISDLAAMGAEPRHALLAAFLPPDMSRGRTEALATGLHAAFSHWGVALVGGDTSATPGPLALSLTLLGRVERGKALLRSGAQPGDWIYVTGTLGDSAAGLALLADPPTEWLGAYDQLVERHRQPRPPLAFGQALSELASAAIDVSDGLVTDLGRIATASGVGIKLEPRAIPLSAALGEWGWASGVELLDYALSGGEDFELAFAVAPEGIEALHRLQYQTDTRCTPIGRVVRERAGEVFAAEGRRLRGGYDHFSPSRERS